MAGFEETPPIERRAPLKESDAMSAHEGLAQMRAKRTQGAQGAPQPATNAVSEAARTLALSRVSKQAPTEAKPAPQKTAPKVDKPEVEAEDNAEELAPEGQDGLEEQPEEGEQAQEEDGDSAITLEDGQSIVIDGETLTAQEIRDSYLRRSDYSRKTQEVARERDQLTQAIGNVTQQSQRLDQIESLLTQAVSQEPDWAALAANWQGTPQQYLAQKEQWQAQKQALQNVINQRQQAVQQTIAQAKVQMFEDAKRTFRPDWQDQAKMQQGLNQLAEFATQQGIRPEELQMLYRTPMLKILDDAFRWNELQKNQRVTEKRVQGKPKPLKPGTQRSRPNGAETALATARQRWESIKTPSTADARDWVQAKRTYEAATGQRVKG